MADNKNRIIAGKKNRIIFAVPGSKVFISNYYRNIPNSFLNISLSGPDCELSCKHCQGILLKGMIDAAREKTLVHILQKFSPGMVKGMLISGGFNRDGILHIPENFREDLKRIKASYGNKIKIYVHAGFVNEKMAASLKDCGIDGVLLNVIGSKTAMEKIYNLKGRDPSDYYDSLAALKEKGLKVSVHLVTGIDEGRISGEFKAVESVIRLKADSLVFVILKRLTREQDLPVLEFNTEEMENLVRYPRELDPGIFVSLGCARPAGEKYREMEKKILDSGIDCMAFPSESTIKYAMEKKLEIIFREECCAFVSGV